MYINSRLYDKMEISITDLAKQVDCTLEELEPFMAAVRRYKWEITADKFYMWLNDLLSLKSPEDILKTDCVSVSMLIRLMQDNRRNKKLHLKSIATIEAIINRIGNGEK